MGNLTSGIPGGLAFWLVGYALAFGDGNGIIGFSNFGAIDLPHSKYTYLFFQVSSQTWQLLSW